MKRILLSIVAVIGLLLLSPVFVSHSTRTPALRAARASLLDFVPSSAPLAVDLSAVVSRWSELRAEREVAAFQDAVLSCVGLDVGIVPRLAGDQVVLFLARSEEHTPVAPTLVVLHPHSPADAEAALSGLAQVCFRSNGEVLWIGPAESRQTLEALTSAPETSFADVMPIQETEERLPPGGLVRGWVNPKALVALLRESSMDRGPAALGLVADVVSTNLAPVRYAAFRRDLSGGELTTDAIVAFDLTQLPAEVTCALGAPNAGAFVAPEMLEAADTGLGRALAVVAFRPQARALIPWLRYLAARDPHGPLRNAGFWVDDFERRFRRDLESDLCDTIGERAWLLAIRSESRSTPDLVLVSEAHPTEATEQTMTDLLAWTGEQVLISSFGAVIPTLWREQGNGPAMHGLTLRTPLGRVSGPCFQLTEQFLFLATSQEALAAGKTWFNRIASIEFLADESPDEAAAAGAILARPSVLAGLIAEANGQTDEKLACVRNAIATLLGETESLNARLYHDRDAIRLHGRIRLASK
jgi:hypothetical protein